MTQQSSPQQNQSAAERWMLGSLLTLEQNLLNAASEEAFTFIAVNELHHLIPFHQALLWRDSGRDGKVVAVSGLPVPDTKAPYCRWVGALCHHVLTADEYASSNHDDASPTLQRVLRALQKRDVPERFAKQWDDWLPQSLLIVELKTADGRRLGALLLSRSHAWSDSELELMHAVAASMGAAWGNFLDARGMMAAVRDSFPVLWRWFLATLVVVILFLVPVRQSILAPGEVVPYRPITLRSPLEGVVESVHVQPNQVVEKGDLLLTLDDTYLRNALVVLEKQVDIVRAEYHQAAQRHVRGGGESGTVPLLRRKLDQKKAEMQYVRDQLNKVRIVAPKPGVVILDDPDALDGQPVGIGQRLFTLADPANVWLRIHLPVADAVTLDTGTEMIFFPFSAPDYSYLGQVRQVGFTPHLVQEGRLAYRLHADFNRKEPLPIGTRGTAKLLHEPVTLFRYLFRRPLNLLRPWFWTSS
ncbi:MAG: HlyD family efflux transporter periplasmic adaptor subunit [Magnetococcales bacterium]|nr:HlyD family efflux transporter periplasmic adaptor subunit [Magnetococcales bacterium]